jgi:hypothetical protein
MTVRFSAGFRAVCRIRWGGLSDPGDVAVSTNVAIVRDHDPDRWMAIPGQKT